MTASSKLSWAAEIAGDELERFQSIAPLPEALQTILMVLWVETALNEGGVEGMLRQGKVMDTSFSSCADAYRRIGLPEFADDLDLAFAIHDREFELINREKRHLLDIWTSPGMRPLRDVDSRLSHRKSVATFLESYVHQQQETFTKVALARFSTTSNSVTTTLRQQAQSRRIARRRVLVRCLTYIGAALSVSFAAGASGFAGVKLRFGNERDLAQYILGGVAWGVIGSGAFFLMRIRHQIHHILLTSLQNEDESDLSASLYYSVLLGAWLMGSLGAVPGVLRNGVFHWEILTAALLGSGVWAIVMIRLNQRLFRSKVAPNTSRRHP